MENNQVIENEYEVCDAAEAKLQLNTEYGKLAEEYIDPATRLLIETVDPSRLRKQLLKKVSEIQALIKDSKPVSYSQTSDIVDMSRLLSKAVSFRAAEKEAKEGAAE